jgi:hypothetical protein
MAHFSTGLWADLVKGTLGGETAAAMRRHLAEHCVGCQEAYRRCSHQESRATTALVFDSFHQALPAGLRSGTSGSRHLLYRTDDVTADLRLEASARTGRLLLIGQVAATRHPGAVIGALRVSVGWNAGGLSLVSNECGEFQCELDRRDDLVLSVELDRTPVISIPLDRLPSPSSTPSNIHRAKNTVNV